MNWRSGNSKRWLAALAVAMALSGGLVTFEVLQAAQATTGPIARYDMRAGTSSGFGGMGATGGGMGSAMSMAFGGGGGGPTHELTLELGSTLAPTGAPKADHFMPERARLGISVPLKTPEPMKSTATQPENPEQQQQFRRPQGRMLIFWGCGEHAPAGQPVVIDFAKMAEGQMPTGLWSGAVPIDRWVNLASSRTYGNWPNADSRKTLSSDSSLIGAHRVVANYAPDIAFTLAHDFMAPLQVNSTIQPSGSVQMSWNLLPDATGYYASLIGGKGTGRGGSGAGGGQMQDLVWWSSASTREFGGGLSDWLSPATVTRLVAAGTVLAPQTGTCTIPVEVHAAAASFMMTTMVGYGPEERFAYPPRPSDPHAVWHIAWEARIRHRSTTSFMPGMPTMGGNRPRDTRADPNGQNSNQPCQPKKRHGLGGLGGLIGGVLPGGGGGDGC